MRGSTPYSGRLRPSRARRTKPTIIKSDDGTRVALVRNDGDRLSLVVDKKSQAKFAAYLVERLPEIYARFCAREEA